MACVFDGTFFWSTSKDAAVASPYLTRNLCETQEGVEAMTDDFTRIGSNVLGSRLGNLVVEMDILSKLHEL